MSGDAGEGKGASELSWRRGQALTKLSVRSAGGWCAASCSAATRTFLQRQAYVIDIREVGLYSVEGWPQREEGD